MASAMGIQSLVAVVTDAASGIGRANANSLAGRDGQLAIADVDGDGPI